MSMTEIRAAAQRLADAHRESISRAKLLETELNQAITPIYALHRAGLDAAAEEEAAAHADLKALVDGAPQLFKKPRSIAQDGVKCGYRKAEDALDWDSDDQVITRIRAFPELADMAAVLIRTEESLNVSALQELDAKFRRKIGVRLIEGIDQSFISFSDSDVEKMVKAILADAAKRQGEDEPVKKKGKAKIKEAA
ncbi:MAG: hypothetical protein D3M94_07270 [Rhodocyclales bacterium GT-UBC]|nr:MAG: hypothetical protein D3M94_07270 [Rhodocyclales bacterium GT-UBC]